MTTPAQSSSWSDLVRQAITDPDRDRREQAWDKLSNLLRWLVRTEMPVWLRTHHESMSVCQSLVEDLWRNDLERLLERCADEDGLRRRLRETVKNKVRMSIRRVRAKKNPPASRRAPDGVIFDVVDSTSPPDQVCVNEEDRRRVQSWFARVGAKHRGLIELSFGRGLRSREVGDRVGMSATGVRKAVQRTLDDARAELDDR